MSVFLVTGNLHGDVRGFAGNRGLDALLEPSMTELDQRILVQPKEGNFPLRRRLHKGTRAGAQFLALCEADEIITFLFEIEITINFTFQLIPDPLRQQAHQQLA